MNCGIWDIDLSTVVSRPVFNLECVLGLTYSLKLKMTQNPKQGIKSDAGLTPLSVAGLTPLSVCAGHTKMPRQYYKLALPIEKHHHQT